MARVCETLSKQSVKRLFMNGLSAAAIIVAMRIPTLAPLVRAAALCLAVGLAVPGMAAEQDAVRKSVQSGQLKPLNTIIADVSRQYGGRVLDVETKRGRDGDLQYEIKLVNARGEKQELLIDAATGAVVPKERSRPVQPVTIAQMVQYVRKLEQSSGARVTNVEFERDAQGNYVYEAQLSDKPFGEVKLMLSVATGEVLNPVKSGAPAVQPKSMAVMLESLQPRYSGRVLDVETKRGRDGDLQYEIKLINARGEKQELLIDAATGAVVPKERSRPVQPVTIAQMVQYVRKLEQSSGARVTNVEFERDAQGNYVYEAQLSDKPFGEVKLMLSVATGEVLNPVKSGAPAVQPKSMAVMLESLQPRYNGRVLEAELETDVRRRLYYSVELQQPNGSKLELEVDAVTLEVLRQKGGD